MSVGDFINKIKTEFKVLTGEETKDKFFDSRNDFIHRDVAVREFQRSKEKLFHVNKWSNLPGIASGFKVFDDQGLEKPQGIPQLGDYILIDLPGPAPDTWVKVIDVLEEEEMAEFTVNPSHDPRKKEEKKEEVDHFFADEATSTFRVMLQDASIYAFEIGKEEGINNKGKKAGGRQLINTVIAVGGWMAFQEMQWRKLTDYLVHKIEIEEENQ